MTWRSDEHWTARADRVADGDHRILGEDDHGDLWVPASWNTAWWSRRLDLRRPSHWIYYLRSRLTRRIAWLEKVVS